MNDMENGNLYFSNWSVLADVASVVQVQRGAGSVNLATPSLGGVVNFMSAPASTEPGVVVKQEAGEHQYSKTAVTVNTGLLMDGKLAMMASASRRTITHVATASGMLDFGFLVNCTPIAESGEV